MRRIVINVGLSCSAAQRCGTATQNGGAEERSGKRLQKGLLRGIVARLPAPPPLGSECSNALSSWRALEKLGITATDIPGVSKRVPQLAQGTASSAIEAAQLSACGPLGAAVASFLSLRPSPLAEVSRGKHVGNSELKFQAKEVANVLDTAGAFYAQCLDTIQLPYSLDSSIAADGHDHPTRVSALCMTPDQQATMDLINLGLNVYIGGNAGTGKSALLRHVASVFCHEKRLNVAVTATTGVAAATLGGVTFHSLFQPTRDFVHFDLSALLAVDVLILDEVSMFDATVLDRFDHAARVARRCPDRPFGGMQVILSGDFLQLRISGTGRLSNRVHHDLRQIKRLAAVEAKTSSTEKLKTQPPSLASSPSKTVTDSSLPAFPDPPAVFRAAVFTNHIIPCTLTTRHRQADAVEFCDALDALRVGQVTPMIIRRVLTDALPNNKSQECIGKGGRPTAVPPQALHLFPTRAAAAEFNRLRLSELDGVTKAFNALVLPVPPHKKRFTCTRTFTIEHRQGHVVSDDRVKQLLERAISQSTASDGSGSRLSSKDVLVFRTATVDAASSFTQRGTDMLGKSSFRARLRVPIGGGLTRFDLDKALGATLTSQTRGGKGALPVQVKDVAAATLDVEQAHWRRVMTSTSLMRLLPPEVRSEVEDAVSETVHLKIGCRVMLLHNLSHSLINGSIGTIVDFKPYRADQLPSSLRRGVHFSDGAFVSLDKREVPPTSMRVLPVVRFDAPAGSSRAADGETAMIPYVVRTVPSHMGMHGFGAAVATLPLALAYGFTVHKVQGVTLDVPVCVDLTKMWPCDHLVYVACSRVRSIENLFIRHLDPRMVTANASSRSFVGSLRSAEDVNAAIAKFGEGAKPALLPHIVNKYNATSYAFWREHQTLHAPAKTALLVEEQAAAVVEAEEQRKQATKAVQQALRRAQQQRRLHQSNPHGSIASARSSVPHGSRRVHVASKATAANVKKPMRHPVTTRSTRAIRPTVGGKVVKRG
jgi:hypothetical protein